MLGNFFASMLHSIYLTTQHSVSQGHLFLSHIAFMLCTRRDYDGAVCKVGEERRNSKGQKRKFPKYGIISN